MSGSIVDCRTNLVHREYYYYYLFLVSGFWLRFYQEHNNRRERDMAEKEERNYFARTRKFHEQQPKTVKTVESYSKIILTLCEVEQIIKVKGDVGTRFFGVFMLCFASTWYNNILNGKKRR
jgi:hypothetical protein